MYNLDIYCLVVQDGVRGDLGMIVLPLVAMRVESAEKGNACKVLTFLRMRTVEVRIHCHLSYKLPDSMICSTSHFHLMYCLERVLPA